MRKNRVTTGRNGVPAFSGVATTYTLICLCGLVMMWPSIGLGQVDASKVISDTSFQNDLRAAGLGDPSAQLRVGKAYYFGTNEATGKGNRTEAMKWFEAGSTGGSKEATAWLGNGYLNGDGVKENKVRGAELIRSAAEANDPVGLRFMALMYHDGNGVRRDYFQAFQLFSKAVALNDPYSYDWLANLYRTGRGTSKNMPKAVELYAEGARLGDPFAQLQLAALYYTGAPEAPLAQDRSRSLQLYEASAAQGNKVAAFYVGKMYASGTGVQQDYKKAVDYYLQAARHRYPPAELSMGEASEHGLGMAVNLLDAYAWYSLAADNGNPKANERLVALTSSFNQSRKIQADKQLRELKRSMPDE